MLQNSSGTRAAPDSHQSFYVLVDPCLLFQINPCSKFWFILFCIDGEFWTLCFFETSPTGSVSYMVAEGNDLLPHSYRKSSGRSKRTYYFHKGICWELPTIFMWALCSQIHLDGSELSVTMTKWLKKSICQVWIALNGPQGSQVKGPAKLTEVGSHIDMTSIGEHVN